MKKIIIALIIIGFLFSAAAPGHKEKDYRKEFNKFIKGQMEYRLPDNTKVDILTDDYAIEVDWAEKWYQAVGQSLHYALVSNRQPGIVLIFKSKKNNIYLNRLLNVLKKYKLNIQVWTITSTFKIKRIQDK